MMLTAKGWLISEDWLIRHAMQISDDLFIGDDQLSMPPTGAISHEERMQRMVGHTDGS